MVDGIESFKAKFVGYEDCYTVIGGAACDILMTEADMDFRQTKAILFFKNHACFDKIYMLLLNIRM